MRQLRISHFADPLLNDHIFVEAQEHPGNHGRQIRCIFGIYLSELGRYTNLIFDPRSRGSGVRPHPQRMAEILPSLSPDKG